MKKQYIKPIINNGLTMESNLLAGSLRGDGLNLQISDEVATGDAQSRQGSGFWTETE